NLYLSPHYIQSALFAIHKGRATSASVSRDLRLCCCPTNPYFYETELGPFRRDCCGQSRSPLISSALMRKLCCETSTLTIPGRTLPGPGPMSHQSNPAIALKLSAHRQFPVRAWFSVTPSIAESVLARSRLHCKFPR